MRRASATLGMLITLVLVAGCGASGESGGAADVSVPDNHGYHGTYLSPPYTVPPVALTDDDNKSFTLATDDRDLDVVFFGYVNCPDVCQVVMGALTSAYLRLPAEDRDRVRVVFVTTDPSRDTPSALHDYLRRFNSDFVGLTGSLDQIDQLGKPMGVFIHKGQKLPSGGYEVDHSTAVYAVSHGKSPLIWSNGTAPTQLTDDVIRLLKVTS